MAEDKQKLIYGNPSAIYLFWNLGLFRGSDAHQRIETEPLEQTYLGVAQALFSDISIRTDGQRRALTLGGTSNFIPPPRDRGGGADVTPPWSFWYVAVFQNNIWHLVESHWSS